MVRIRLTLLKNNFIFFEKYCFSISSSLILIFLKLKSRNLGVLCDVSQPKHKKSFCRMTKGLLTVSQLNRMIWATRKISCGTIPAIFRCNTASFDIFRIQAPRDRGKFCLFSCSILFFRHYGMS